MGEKLSGVLASVLTKQWNLRGDFKMFYQMCAGKLWS
ncbi:hypothetical protein predicted by Glimmer/Critica [Bdellovibrio bacteriovorus HD100]|uniref:Uncharacterized protein n=1 Tax=Bdellovibrio bacteriovorus (strain ATCC 15356 / DSM 50701 / NCIMB 9529 / HD100) TaxID=264462 RepID=Q6MM03_BDEBA|nr:hypothetical protein predicted by Glimmer/Critica [Bdellovibrio bacteriovorus HD100]